MFKHNLVNLPKLERVDVNGKRHYSNGNDVFPSVTTIISETSDNSWIEEWKKRVGEEEANRISKLASIRGTTIHGMCEKYILEGSIDYKSYMPFDVLLFNQIKSVLDNSVDEVFSSEGMLLSKKLKVGGTVDLVANFLGNKSIIDFKTSKKEKNIEDIEGYFIQTAMYAYMFWETTSILCNKLVVVIASEETPNAKVFTQNSVDYLRKAKQLCEKYHGEYNATNR